MKHLIIGAGFSGLPIAKKLVELGENFEVVDKNSGIGGLWHTGVYRDAHIISSRLTTEFPDYPMPSFYPDFPRKAEMQAYFESYAETFGLTPHIRLNTAVRRVRPAPDFDQNPSWRVTFESGEEQTYRTVTIANGHNWSPRKVERPGHFDGEMISSNAYQDSTLLQGKRTLVIGYGNTGCDIAVDAGRVGREASISMRSGTYFFPRMFMGIPLADLVRAVPIKADFIDRAVGRLIIALTVGDLERYGVPKPTFRPFDKHPIVNSDLIQAIRLGRVKVRPDVERFEGKTVHFTDGTRGEFDLIVWATGYKIDFPMLDPADQIIDFEGELPRLFLQVMAPKYRGLFTPGIGQARTGGGPLYEASGYATARLIAHEARSARGAQADLRALPELRFVESPLGRWLTGERLTKPADMRSRGLHTQLKKLRHLSRLLDRIGAPKAPSRRAANAQRPPITREVLRVLSSTEAGPLELAEHESAA